MIVPDGAVGRQLTPGRFPVGLIDFLQHPGRQQFLLDMTLQDLDQEPA